MKRNDTEKAAWGIYSVDFWSFYESMSQISTIEYGIADEAIRAAKSMLTIKRHKGISEVRIIRKKNIIFLERQDRKGDSGYLEMAEVFLHRLEELDAMIKPLEDEYRRTAAELMRIGGR